MTESRVSRLAALVLLVAAVVMLLLLLAQRVDAGGELRLTESYTVLSGDTLWEIGAGRTAPGGDVRDTVSDIVALNHLGGGFLRPGQVLVVPAD